MSEVMTKQSGQMDDTADSEKSLGPGQDFVRLFTQAQRSLYLFILPLVHSSADAEEVLQETNVVILRYIKLKI
jgi:DNA-directed RNA polymerase specialized sigma24 family protein